MRHCPFCKNQLNKGDEMFLRIVPKGFFVFEHRIGGKKYCQKVFEDTNSVAGAKRLIKTLGM